jgi:hypothetical protein
MVKYRVGLDKKNNRIDFNCTDKGPTFSLNLGRSTENAVFDKNNKLTIDIQNKDLSISLVRKAIKAVIGHSRFMIMSIVRV